MINSRNMKSTFRVAVLAFVILSVGLSCNKADMPVRSVVFKIDPYQQNYDDGPLTRTSIINNGTFIWAEGDTVGIYPNSGSQVFFAMESEAGASSAKFDGGGWAFKPSAVYYSYYPFIGDIYLDRTHIPVRFVGQKQTSISDVEHIGPFDYMYTLPSSASNGEVSFTYKHLCCIIRPLVTLPAGTWTKLAITAPSKVFATKGYFDLTAVSPEIVPTATSEQIQIDLEGITLTEQTSFMIYVLSAPVDLKGKEIIVSVRNSLGQEFQCKKTPSYVYTAGFIGGLTCNSWVEAPMSLIIDDWGDGGSISGTAE